MKKKLMNMTENRPTPKLDRKDVAVPMNEETLETKPATVVQNESDDNDKKSLLLRVFLIFRLGGR